MTTISDDDGDHINIAIPNYDKAAFDVLLRGIKIAVSILGPSLDLPRNPTQVPEAADPAGEFANPRTEFQLSSERAKKLRLGIRTD